MMNYKVLMLWLLTFECWHWHAKYYYQQVLSLTISNKICESKFMQKEDQILGCLCSLLLFHQMPSAQLRVSPSPLVLLRNAQNAVEAAAVDCCAWLHRCARTAMVQIPSRKRYLKSLVSPPPIAVLFPNANVLYRTIPNLTSFLFRATFHHNWKIWLFNNAEMKNNEVLNFLLQREAHLYSFDLLAPILK